MKKFYLSINLIIFLFFQNIWSMQSLKELVSGTLLNFTPIYFAEDLEDNNKSEFVYKEQKEIEYDFNTSFYKLDSEVQNFVENYQKWPSFLRDKIKIFSNDYLIDPSLNESFPEYYYSLSDWLAAHLTDDNRKHFVNVLQKIRQKEEIE
ncbi:MAG: hypothetical protein WDZ41_02140 [Candidatus Babeliales bacterium]